jgi:hypothetical protein
MNNYKKFNWQYFVTDRRQFLAIIKQIQRKGTFNKYDIYQIDNCLRFTSIRNYIFPQFEKTPSIYITFNYGDKVDKKYFFAALQDFKRSFEEIEKVTEIIKIYKPRNEICIFFKKLIKKLIKF